MLDPHRQRHPARGLGQERALPRIAFDKRHLEVRRGLGAKCGDDETWQSGASSEIRPFFGGLGSKGAQLGAVLDMAAPEVGFR